MERERERERGEERETRRNKGGKRRGVKRVARAAQTANSPESAPSQAKSLGLPFHLDSHKTKRRSNSGAPEGTTTCRSPRRQLHRSFNNRKSASAPGQGKASRHTGLANMNTFIARQGTCSYNQRRADRLAFNAFSEEGMRLRRPRGPTPSIRALLDYPQASSPHKRLFPRVLKHETQATPCALLDSGLCLARAWNPLVSRRRKQTDRLHVSSASVLERTTTHRFALVCSSCAPLARSSCILNAGRRTPAPRTPCGGTRGGRWVDEGGTRRNLVMGYGRRDGGAGGGRQDAYICRPSSPRAQPAALVSLKILAQGCTRRVVGRLVNLLLAPPAPQYFKDICVLLHRCSWANLEIT